MSIIKLDGTKYDITGGFTMQNAAQYELECGLTKRDGTIYEIDINAPEITDTVWELTADPYNESSYTGTWIAPYTGYYRVTGIGGGGGGGGTVAMLSNLRNSDYGYYIPNIYNGVGGGGGSGYSFSTILKIRRRSKIEYEIGKGGAGGTHKNLGAVTSTAENSAIRVNDYLNKAATDGKDGTETWFFDTYANTNLSFPGGSGGTGGYTLETYNSSLTFADIWKNGKGGDGQVNGGTVTSSSGSTGSYSTLEASGGSVDTFSYGAGGSTNTLSCRNPNGEIDINKPMNFITITQPSAGQDGLIKIEFLQQDTPDLQKYAVSVDLENYTISNTVNHVYEGDSYIATITPNDTDSTHYYMDAFSVTMNGEDVTDSYVTYTQAGDFNVSAVINIPVVTGNIEIKCTPARYIIVFINNTGYDAKLIVDGTNYATGSYIKFYEQSSSSTILIEYETYSTSLTPDGPPTTDTTPHKVDYILKGDIRIVSQVNSYDYGNAGRTDYTVIITYI